MADCTWLLLPCQLSSPLDRAGRTDRESLLTEFLQYWVVFSFFTVLESFVQVVHWFPFYYVFKFIFLLWLSLPAFRYVMVQILRSLPPVRCDLKTDTKQGR